MKGTISLACGILLAAGSAAYAQDDANSNNMMTQEAGTAAETTVYSKDTFRRDIGFNTLHHMHLSEIELAKIGMERAQSPEVKAFAGQLQKDHQAAEKTLQDNANARNVTLEPFSPATFQMAAWDDLKKIKGPQFDQAFMDYIKTTHEWMNESLSQLKKDAKDPVLKEQIAELKPTWDKHLKMAKSIDLPEVAS